MQLSEINFGNLKNCTPENRWGAGTTRDRFLYCDAEFWYKTWGEGYLSQSPYGAAGELRKHRSLLQKPHGFEVGLFVPEISAAFQGFIYDENNNVRGYITKAGAQPKRISENFIEAVYQACINCGWAYADFCFNNVIETEGQLSLIDFDTHLSEISTMDIGFEEKNGALRPHIFSKFSEQLKGYLKPLET